nr:hypothetical protein CFP56_33442 [Quercus suber]
MGGGTTGDAKPAGVARRMNRSTRLCQIQRRTPSYGSDAGDAFLGKYIRGYRYSWRASLNLHTSHRSSLRTGCSRVRPYIHGAANKGIPQLIKHSFRYALMQREIRWQSKRWFRASVTSAETTIGRTCLCACQLLDESMSRR